MSTIPTPECTCLVTTEHRILDRDCPRHGDAAEAARHHPWCDPTECRTGKDGQIVHRSTGESFELNTTQIWTASLLTTQLVETAGGIEVGVRIEGAAVTSITATLFPEVAVELAKSLLDHAERAGEPSMAMTADLATLLDALEDVSIIDEERHTLRWLAAFGAHTVEHLAALITRARRNSAADR